MRKDEREKERERERDKRMEIQSNMNVGWLNSAFKKCRMKRNRLIGLLNANPLSLGSDFAI